MRNFSSIGVAVAGAGFIGPVHVEALKRLGVHVTGVLGKGPAKSDQAARRLGLPRGYASYDEVLADNAVEAVHLALPNVLHYKYSRRALLANKHVMCEKPLALDASEAHTLVAQAKEAGLHAGVCYNIRFYPLNLDVRERLKKMGRIFSVVGRYVQDWLLYDTDYNWRVLASEGGTLRAVADIGTHWMDLIVSVTGLAVEAVFADLRTVHKVRNRPVGEVKTFTGSGDVAREPVNVETDDTGCILFRFKGGAQGMLWVSQVTAGRKNMLQYEISASKGALAWNSERPNELWLGHRDKPSEVFLRDPALLSDLARGYTNYPGGHNEGFPDAFKGCFRAFYSAIASNAPLDDVLYPTFAQGAHEIVLCDAILQSHREERWVSL